VFPSLQEIARAVGGEIRGGQVLAPGPGHSAEDRSLSITLSESPPGYVVYSFAGDDPIECKDYVRAKLGQPPWKPNGGSGRDPVIADYVYRTADGKPYLRVQRTASKKFWQQRAEETSGSTARQRGQEFYIACQSCSRPIQPRRFTLSKARRTPTD
jgi:hypothetical protein